MPATRSQPMALDATMDIDESLETHAVAALACASCRKHKRKCDKQVPTCGLCERLGRQCEYTDDVRGPPSNEDFASLKQEVMELKMLLSAQLSGRTTSMETENDDSKSNATQLSTGSSSAGSSQPFPPSIVSSDATSATNGALVSSHYSEEFAASSISLPNLYFLDSPIFSYAHCQLSIPHVPVPPEALALLGTAAELRAAVEDYFASVHLYYPMVSKIRLSQHLSDPMHELGADMALLFLAMKLSASLVAEDLTPITPLYQSVKRLLGLIERHNAYSIQTIQALLLICLYEIGHAIYPAAYFSVGHAARMGYAMGLHDHNAPQMLPRTVTWTEQEERRRVWWAVVVLDRSVNIGHRRKPFAAQDPDLANHLPIDDGAWDRGQMLVAAPLALSASPTIETTPFARTCQTAHFLGKVIRHINDTTLPADYRFDEAIQLARVGHALAEVVPHDAGATFGSLAFSSSEALCQSALMILYDRYSCTQDAIQNGPETQLRVQKICIEGLSTSSRVALELARRVREHVSHHGLREISPLILDCLYAGAANYAWYVRESSDRECAECLAELKGVLGILQRRWRAAGEYLRIVEASEFAYTRL